MSRLDGTVESTNVRFYGSGDSPVTHLILQDNDEGIYFKGVAPVPHNHYVRAEGEHQSVIDILIEVDPERAALILRGVLPSVEGRGFHASNIDDDTARISYVKK